MKKTMIVLAALGAFTTMPAFAHHPAEDIVDADTWLMIDSNLQEVDSPHLDLDFSM